MSQKIPEMSEWHFSEADFRKQFENIELPRRVRRGLRGKVAQRLMDALCRPYLSVARSQGGINELRAAVAYQIQLRYALDDVSARDIARRLMHGAPVDVRGEGLLEPWLSDAIKDGELVRQHFAEHTRAHIAELGRQICRALADMDRMAETEGVRTDTSEFRERLRQRIAAELGGEARVDLRMEGRSESRDDQPHEERPAGRQRAR